MIQVQNTKVRVQDYCCFCQRLMHDIETRHLNIDVMKDFVKSKLQPTPYWYHTLLNMPNHMPAICVACTNWKRRIEKRGKIKGKYRLSSICKPFLQVSFLH